MDEARKQHIEEFRKRFHHDARDKGTALSINEKQCLDFAFFMAERLTPQRRGKRSVLVEELAVRCLADDDFLVTFIEGHLTSVDRAMELLVKAEKENPLMRKVFSHMVKQARDRMEQLDIEELKTKEEGA